VTSFNAIDTSTAMNQRFSYETTGIVIHGATEDAPRDDTTYFFTVTNESDGPGEFFSYWRRSTTEQRCVPSQWNCSLLGDHDDD
jgi:hypothetical protein